MVPENIDLQELEQMVVEIRDFSGVITVVGDIQPDGTYLLFEGEHFPRIIMDLLHLDNIKMVSTRADVTDDHQPIVVTKFEVLKL